MAVKMTFTEPLLGMASGNPDIHAEFIASKAPTLGEGDEEIKSIPVSEQIEKASTVFPRDEKGLFLWDYQIKGMFKETLAVLIELGDLTAVSKWAIKGAVGNFVFVRPRRIYLHKEDGSIWTAPNGSNQRPLSVETLQGPRIALARSESLPPGTWIEWMVELLQGTNTKSKKAGLTREDLEAALRYGAERGFGQWRNGGWGRHVVEMKEL